MIKTRESSSPHTKLFLSGEWVVDNEFGNKWVLKNLHLTGSTIYFYVFLEVVVLYKWNFTLRTDSRISTLLLQFDLLGWFDCYRVSKNYASDFCFHGFGLVLGKSNLDLYFLIFFIKREDLRFFFPPELWIIIVRMMLI